MNRFSKELVKSLTEACEHAVGQTGVGACSRAARGNGNAGAKGSPRLCGGLDISNPG
jgi:hypothetical protein